MIAYPNEKCNNVRRTMDFYRKKQMENFEFERHLEDLRLKKLLKQAVEKEFAPQSLVDAIRSQIRR